jgi:Mg2+/citrate symporter
MDAFRVIATVVVLIAVAVFILLFEKKRATRIERDLSEMSQQRRKRRSEEES